MTLPLLPRPLSRLGCHLLRRRASRSGRHLRRECTAVSRKGLLELSHVVLEVVLPVRRLPVHTPHAGPAAPIVSKRLGRVIFANPAEGTVAPLVNRRAIVGRHSPVWIETGRSSPATPVSIGREHAQMNFRRGPRGARQHQALTPVPGATRRALPVGPELDPHRIARAKALAAERADLAGVGDAVALDRHRPHAAALRRQILERRGDGVRPLVTRLAVRARHAGVVAIAVRPGTQGVAFAHEARVAAPPAYEVSGHFSIVGPRAAIRAPQPVPPLPEVARAHGEEL
jgi:hypothetical protein